MANQKFFKLGVQGIDLSEDELHMSNESVLSAQNAEVVLDVEKGGEMALSKRGGLTALGVSLGTSVFEIIPILIIEEIASAATETLRGFSVTFNDGWFDELGFSVVDTASIDEVTPNDADYHTAVSPSGELDNVIYQLDPASFVGAATAGTLRIRARYRDNSGTLGQELVVIVLGSGGTPTVMDSQVGPSPLVTGAGLTSSFQTFEFDIFDYGYAGASFDWTAITISVILDGTVTTNDIEVSWLELELTHA